MIYLPKTRTSVHLCILISLRLAHKHNVGLGVGVGMGVVHLIAYPEIIGYVYVAKKVRDILVCYFIAMDSFKESPA